MWIFLFVCLVIPSSAYAQERIRIENGQVELGRQLQVLEDSSKTMTVEDVLGAPADAFVQSQQDVVSLGFSNSAFWFRFGVEADSQSPQILLQLGYPLLEEIDVFLVRDGDIIAHQSTGLSKPFDSREIDHPLFIIPVDVERNTDVFVRVSTRSSYRIPMTLWKPH